MKNLYNIKREDFDGAITHLLNDKRETVGYVGGDMLTTGEQEERAKEGYALQEAVPQVNWYVPHKNKDINDKQAASLRTDPNLPEKIVIGDTNKILLSDVLVFSVRETGIGTCIEMGQVKGMFDVATMNMLIIHDTNVSKKEKLLLLEALNTAILSKDIYLHTKDIRYIHEEDRTPEDVLQYVVHAYLLGVARSIANHGDKDLLKFEDLVTRVAKCVEVSDA